MEGVTLLWPEKAGRLEVCGGGGGRARCAGLRLGFKILSFAIDERPEPLPKGLECFQLR